MEYLEVTRKRHTAHNIVVGAMGDVYKVGKKKTVFLFYLRLRYLT